MFIPEWMDSVKEIVMDLLKEQTILVLKKARDTLIKLLVNGLSSTLILIYLVKVFLNDKRLNDMSKMEVIHWASFYEHR